MSTAMREYVTHNWFDKQSRAVSFWSNNNVYITCGHIRTTILNVRSFPQTFKNINEFYIMKRIVSLNE